MKPNKKKKNQRKNKARNPENSAAIINVPPISPNIKNGQHTVSSDFSINSDPLKS